MSAKGQVKLKLEYSFMENLDSLYMLNKGSTWFMMLSAIGRMLL